MLALIEIKRRKLQFGLVTGVVALISYLIIMVTGLGLGLNERAGTGLLSLNGDYVAYALRLVSVHFAPDIDATAATDCT